jgi:hypothetical protein
MGICLAVIPPESTQQDPAYKTMDICYWEEFIVIIIHFLLHLVFNTRASRTIIKGLPIMTCGWIWWSIRLYRSLVSSSLQFMLHTPVKARLLMTLVFRTPTNCPTVGLFFEPQCQWKTNVRKGILFQASCLDIVKLWPFKCSPHMLGSTNINDPPILWWSKFLEGRLIIFQEDPAPHPHTCLVQWPIWELLSLSRLPGAARFMLLKLWNSLSMSLSNMTTARYLLLNTPDKKETHT